MKLQYTMCEYNWVCALVLGVSTSRSGVWLAFIYILGSSIRGIYVGHLDYIRAGGRLTTLIRSAREVFAFIHASTLNHCRGVYVYAQESN